MRTPFIGGGEVTPAGIGAFLWACHRYYELPKKNWLGRIVNKKRDKFLLALADLDFGEIEYKIDEFLDETFFDAPQGGGKGETPYVCGIAWMEYRMACDPFRWSSDRTLDTPLRRIYQLLRCDDIRHGAVLFNRYSDGVKDEFMRDLAALDELQTVGRN